jgi:arylsulfatase A-like enzyme
VALALAAVSWSCRGPGEDRLVRLVDLADRETIVESPLLTASPVGEPATRTLWGGSFTESSVADLGWLTGGAGLSFFDDPEHGRITCVSDGRERFHSILLAARPLARYRVTRVVRSDRPGLDLRVLETSRRLKTPDEVNGTVDRLRLLRGTLLGRNTISEVHRFPAPELSAAGAAGAWHRASVDFTTGLDTHAIAVLFNRVGVPSGATACLAEVTIEEVEATPGQELVLLARAWNRPGATAPDLGAPELGLVKRGSLLPVRRLRATRPPYDDNYEHRDALFAPAPTTLRFPLRVPAGGRLTFSYALARGSRFGDSARFEVTVVRGGERTDVFAETVAIGSDGGGWHWRQAEVALDRWSGREVELELRTRFADPGGTRSREAPGERGFALWGNPLVDAPRRPGDPPNVVLIGIDTLRADRVSSYGYRRNTTPHLDGLAAEGVRFDQTVSASNWTAPAFASILTGLPVSRHGVINGDLAMSDRVETLAERLRAGGWRTHAVVYKAFLFGLGLEQGFDRWFNLPTSRRTAQVNLDKALAWLERHHDRRFFLFLHLDDPHQPFNQPPPFDLAFGDARAHEELAFDLPISIRLSGVDGCPRCSGTRGARPEFVPVAQALYDGAVAYTDDRIGALLERLREYGIYDDTVVAVVSDHGELIYDRQGVPAQPIANVQGGWGHGSARLIDALVRVPMILKPALGRRFEPGRVVREQVRVTDLMPTILEAVGLTSEPSPGDGSDSGSLWPLIEGREEGDRIAFVENPRRGVAGLRTREWKYAVHSRAGAQPFHQLYDLRADPEERTNVASRHPEELARLGDALASYLLRTRPGPFLLALGDGGGGSYRLVLESGDRMGFRPLVGLLPVRTADPGGGDSTAAAGGRVLALVELDLHPGQAVRASLLSGGRTIVSRTATHENLLAWAPGTLERLAELPAPSLYFLHGAPPIDADREAATTNLDQLEDLRALGYIE